MAGSPSVLDNTPWWLPDVTVAGAGPGVIVQRCNPFGYETGGPKHLEGGFYGLEHLGPHVWQCKARADNRYRTRCRCGHQGKPTWLCNGHARMFAQRMSGVCPPCAHPPAELEIQAQMASVRQAAAAGYRTPVQLSGYLGRLWDLQHKLDELVQRGIVHRCRVRLEAIS